ncbi:MAG: hypothetical protein Q8R01_03550 [Ramlibacter sp.]|nr:hypothetical protein [Ramlibacter sp.]
MPTHTTVGDGTTAAPARPIEIAKEKADSVQEDLAVAGAELHLTNTALDRSLPQSAKQGDVGKALEQNGIVQQKVSQAAEELAEVTELLEEEIAERHRLEAQLARRGMSENG